MSFNLSIHFSADPFMANHSTNNISLTLSCETHCCVLLQSIYFRHAAMLPLIVVRSIEQNIVPPISMVWLKHNNVVDHHLIDTSNPVRMVNQCQLRESLWGVQSVAHILYDHQCIACLKLASDRSWYFCKSVFQAGRKLMKITNSLSHRIPVHFKFDVSVYVSIPILDGT